MEEELAKVSVLEDYLPKQLSNEELTIAIKEVISQVNAQGPKDMGKVMGIASKKFAGVADGKVVSEKVKTLLSEMA